MNDDPHAPTTQPHARVREALAAGDAGAALDHIDALPSAERADHLAEVWMLAGSARALRALLSTDALLSADARTRAGDYLASPPRRPLPDHEDPAAYERLSNDADRLAALGRAAELALTHLSLSKASPRSDWRAVHVEHAAALAFGLDDPRLSALVRAFEAERDLDFGELEDALEAARAAVAAGLAADEPRAVSLGEAVLAAVTAREHELDPTRAFAATDLEPDRRSEPEDL